MDIIDFEALVERLVQAPGLHLRLEVALGGEQQSDVCLALVSFADAAVDLALQHSQERPLHLQGEFSDLIKEERDLLGEGHEPFLVLGGSGKGSPAVAEQLAARQLFLQGGAVLDDERLVGPPLDYFANSISIIIEISLINKLLGLTNVHHSLI